MLDKKAQSTGNRYMFNIQVDIGDADKSLFVRQYHVREEDSAIHDKEMKKLFRYYDEGILAYSIQLC